MSTGGDQRTWPGRGCAEFRGTISDDSLQIQPPARHSSAIIRQSVSFLLVGAIALRNMNEPQGNEAMCSQHTGLQWGTHALLLCSDWRYRSLGECFFLTLKGCT